MILDQRLGIPQLVLVSLLTYPAQAQSNSTSLYTKAGATLTHCKKANAPVEGFSCTGVAGWALHIGFPAFGATMQFTHDGRSHAVHAPDDGHEVYIEDLASKATTIEWRGIVKEGRFEPYAAIARVLVVDAALRQEMIEQGVPAPSARRAQVLTVFRLGREGSCAIAYVDVQANPKSNELARMAADTQAKTSSCPVGAVKVVGMSTAILRSYMSKP